MRALLPLLSLSLCLSLVSSPAFAGNGHQAHRDRARSHDEAGAKNNKGKAHNNGRSAQARAEAARAEAARADRARADRARAEAAQRDRARSEAARRDRARAEAAHRDHARAEAARREAARRRAAHHAHGRPVPPPARRVVVTSGPAPRKGKAPSVFANREGQLSVGLSAGSLVSGYDSGSSFGDMGLGLTGRYRVTPGFGLEASLSQHRGGEGERITTPLSLGVQGFGFATGRVNPYASAGVTFTGRDFDDTFCDGEDFSTFVTDDTLFGPYGALGMELAVSQNATISLEGRLSTYMNTTVDDPTVPVSFGAKAGLNFYF
jgi:opacity protein-like surface antigen